MTKICALRPRSEIGFENKFKVGIHDQVKVEGYANDQQQLL